MLVQFLNNVPVLHIHNAKLTIRLCQAIQVVRPLLLDVDELLMEVLHCVEVPVFQTRGAIVRLALVVGASLVHANHFDVLVLSPAGASVKVLREG